MRIQNKNFFRMLVIVCLVMFAGIFAGRSVVQAASEYEKLFVGDTKPDEGVKHGKYYFKYSDKDYKIYMSTKKKSGYKETPIQYVAYVNEKQAYYVREGKLYKYVFSTRKEVKLKSLPQKNYAYWNVSLVYGGKVFLTRSCFDEWSISTYAYYTDTKKFTRIKKNCEIIGHYGKYVVSQNEFRSDVSPYPVTLWKLTTSGLKKIKKLTSRGFGCVFIEGKLYYTSYADDLMRKVTLYKCNVDGTQKKKIVTFESDDEYDTIMIQEITSSYCTIWKTDGTYKYIYKTKEMKKID